MSMKLTTKDRVRALLEQASGAYVSGEEIAQKLELSRNSVWKAIVALRAQGCEIEGATNRGYRLVSSPSAFCVQSIARLIYNPRIKIDFRDSVTSTNIVAKELAEAGAPEGTLVVANTQSAGRGRQGRSFFSPAGTGAYFSLVLRPRFSLADVSLITSYAACCLATAIDECTGKHAQIKWVNDVFVDGRKVSGILSEASFDAETQTLSYVVVGIGVNVIEPAGGFKDADGIAGALMREYSDADALRSKIVAATINEFMRGYERIPQKPHLADYRARSLLDGCTVHAIIGTEEFNATVLGINDDFTLQVRLANGEERALASGEVHIPSSQLVTNQRGQTCTRAQAPYNNPMPCQTGTATMRQAIASTVYSTQ